MSVNFVWGKILHKILQLTVTVDKFPKNFVDKMKTLFIILSTLTNSDNQNQEKSIATIFDRKWFMVITPIKIILIQDTLYA